MALSRDPILALGLMSGTSFDAIDVALIETDGEARLRRLGVGDYPYPSELRQQVRAILGRRSDDQEVQQVAGALTELHAQAVQQVIRDRGWRDLPIALIGFHGQTIAHDPAHGVTVQIGDGARLAELCQCPVVCDFRSADVAAGGQGAPLVPLYHRALAADLPRPLAVLNLGGVGNVTWIGEKPDDGENLLAFDTGPANAPLDDWCLATTGQPYDGDGALALSGHVDALELARLTTHPYFRQAPPKSLDRDTFQSWLQPALAGQSAADGAALLTALVAASVARGTSHFPRPPRRWLVSGGGRRNGALMAALSQALEAPVEPVEAVGWDGDGLEAEAFAYLAVRSRHGLPLSLPGTTGVPHPMTGGQLFGVP